VGKTALFISFIKNYLEAVNGAENASRVLIAVPTEKLAVQTAKAFSKFMPDIAPTIETDGDAGQEIDWEKSDIGLQYSKKKHAQRKPRVLITTYQSLARDTENKIYPPEEYGFIIYDEGHAITAPSFGKAVEKFHDATQLAVTATPEYTETKTVGAKLPHRYHQLPLAKAITKGELCNVRPAILKTGYRIDEKLFQRFMEQQSGSPLNEAQLQQLLNQEARNKAVIETYFRGSDPDSGERYFGQNGMIFCTAVKHADSMVEQFRKTLEKPGDGHTLKRWLDNENIELIAPVHGQSKGAWLKKGLLPENPEKDRKFQGGKEWYSEEEIFDLHDKGKILLIASVAKLKWGYDSPRDSLLFDLADRFSKVDATQIDGRAFRIDPDNPDKTATVFNLMDENTEDLYAKYPKMIPIYCAEVIEGAEFRRPRRRLQAQIRFKEPPPGLEKSLQDAGFEILTDIDAVLTISRDNKNRREEARSKAPAKGDWLSGVDLTKIYVGSTLKFTALFEQYATAKRAELEKEGKKPEEAQEIVARDFVGVKSSGNTEGLCASPEVIEELKRDGKITVREDQQAPPSVDAAGAGFVARVGKRPVAPGSKHLKPTGRALGGKSES
ncbi:MAG: DEAD/DEAH box helicase, partial [Alphaproteobacteria bacterium]